MHDWSGFFIGAHAGYGGADVNGVFDTSDIGSPDENFKDDGEGPFDLNLDGFVGGIQAGVNWQSGNFVFGLEGDVSFVDWSDKIVSDDNNAEQVWAETNFVGTLRGRAGYAMDNLLLFGTAGIAITDTEFTAEDDPGPTDPDRDSVDLDDIGFVVGGGAEFALNESWSFKAEGLYFMFNDKKDTDTLTSDSDAGDFAELDDAWMARIGVNFHF
jgi:outer membrane immunogenic protein